MPAKPKPWFRTQDGWWYLRVNGKPQRLVEGIQNADEAERLWHAVMSRPQRVAVIPGMVTAQDVVNLFLAYLKTSGVKERTLKWYFDYIHSFNAAIQPDLLAADIKPLHVTAWINSQTKWRSGSTKHGAVRTIRRAFHWAVDEGHLDRYPLGGLKGYSQTPREIREGDASLEEILSKTKDAAFRDFVTFVAKTGCRPQEARAITAAMVSGNRVVFSVAGSKGKRQARVIYLVDDTLEIVQRLAKARPAGAIFRNMRGRPWTKNSINCRFRRMRVKLNGKRTFAYLLRHHYATEGLKAGVDPVSLAALIGHADPTMLARVYAHVSADEVHMANMARKAMPEAKPPPEPEVKETSGKKRSRRRRDS